VSLSNLLIAKVVLPLRGSKRRYASVERTRRHIADLEVRPAPFAPPRLLDRRAEVALDRRHGWPVYDLRPRAGERPARHVLYLHGGAYIHEIARSHWLFLGHLVKEAPCRCFVPIYPLGRVLGPAATVATVADLAADLVDEVGADELVLMGDSAGGGLALAAAQALRDRGLSAGRLILISPWLDVATGLPEQREIEPRDAMLAIPGLVESGRTYAGELPLSDPRVSPIHGDMRGLPPVAVFTGTDDLLNPDARRMRAACAGARTECELIEAPGMQHEYPLQPTPEGRAARRRIVELIRSVP
jgi:monoterpene epsilon-lactone hydrolase